MAEVAAAADPLKFYVEEGVSKTFDLPPSATRPNLRTGMGMTVAVPCTFFSWGEDGHGHAHGQIFFWVGRRAHGQKLYSRGLEIFRILASALPALH